MPGFLTTEQRVLILGAGPTGLGAACRLPRARTKPGRLALGLPPAPPGTPETMETILANFERIVMPGMTHWQHPRFFAYFPANAAPASMLAEQDTRVSEPQGMQQEMQQLYANFAGQAAFIEPEVLRIGSPKVEAFLKAEPRLAPYAFYLRDIVRREAHTLSDPDEKLLADAGPLSGSAAPVDPILATAELP